MILGWSVDSVLLYGSPALFLAGLLLIMLFLYIGRLYRTREEEAANGERDDNVMLLAIWLIVLSEAFFIAYLVRSC